MLFSQRWHWLIVFTSFKWHHLIFFPRAGSQARWHLCGTGMIWHDHCFSLEEWSSVWTPLCSPFQNVCAGTAINQAVLTQRCNPSCLSLGLIYIILSGPRAQMHPGKGGDWAREKERLRPFSPGTGRGLRAELGNDLSVQRLGCLFAEEKLGCDWQQGCFCRFPCSWQVIMKLCQSIMDMDMPDYVDSLDSSYTMLEFENLRVLPNNTGEISVCFLLNNLYYLC